MLVCFSVELGRRAVDKDNIPVVGKFQDTCHSLRMELSNFIHHAVQLEIFELS